MFRRMLGGEQLSAEQQQAVRAENDSGTLSVDGRQVAVEFYNLNDFVDDVGEVFEDNVTAPIVDTVEDIGDS